MTVSNAGTYHERVDPIVEQAALACLARGEPKEALRILMTAYGAAITAYTLRILRDRELANDVRQKVFLQAYQGFDTFERRSSLWSWLCGIAYHRCLDELKRARPTTEVDLDELVGSSELSESASRVAQQRALECCLGKLSVAHRTQVLMRYFFHLSHAEIGELVGEKPVTVQVRLSRILPSLRRCLSTQGMDRSSRRSAPAVEVADP